MKAHRRLGALLPPEIARILDNPTRAVSTRKTLEDQWAGYARWCDSTGIGPFPVTPENVLGYLRALAARRAPAGEVPSSAYVRYVARALSVFHSQSHPQALLRQPAIQQLLAEVRAVDRRVEIVLLIPYPIDVGTSLPVGFLFERVS